MQIIHLTPYYAPAYAFGGVARATEGMATALAQQGHTVTVITTDALNASTRYDGPLDVTVNGVRVIRVANFSVWLRGRANLSTPGGLRRAANDVLTSADVLHAHEFRTTENLLLTPLADRLGVPMALSPHGTLSHTTGRGLLKRGWDALLSRRVARRFKTVIGLSNHETAQAAALWRTFGAVDTRFEVVPNGVTPSEFAALPGSAPFRARWGIDARRVVLYMGRLHPRKGADKLARAFIAAALPDTHLIIAGPDEGLRPTLDALAADHPTITLTGYLDGPDRLQALAAADLFVLPAVGEGLPMSALEAMAAGVPVLLSEECHLPEVGMAGAGRIIAPTEPAITDGLRSMLADDLPAMAQAARQLIRDRFTWAAVAEQLSAVYSAMAHQAPA